LAASTVKLLILLMVPSTFAARTAIPNHINHQLICQWLFIIIISITVNYATS
jgi:hypothetical protein